MYLWCCLCGVFVVGAPCLCLWRGVCVLYVVRVACICGVCMVDAGCVSLWCGVYLWCGVCVVVVVCT